MNQRRPPPVAPPVFWPGPRLNSAQAKLQTERGAVAPPLVWPTMPALPASRTQKIERVPPPQVSRPATASRLIIPCPSPLTKALQAKTAPVPKSTRPAGTTVLRGILQRAFEEPSTDPKWLTEILQRFNDKDGALRFAAATRKVLKDFSLLAGYEYQAAVAQLLGDNLKALEVSFEGRTQQTRIVDLVTTADAWIECKAYAKKYDPEDGEKRGFFLQAVDYACSGKLVEYRFKNGAPVWAERLLYCVCSWCGKLTIGGMAPKFQPPPFSSRDSVPEVKKAKTWYQDIFHLPPDPLDALPEKKVESPSHTAGARDEPDPYANGMFVANLDDLRRMPQTPTIQEITSSIEELIKDLSPEQLRQMDEPYWYYGRLKW